MKEKITEQKSKPEERGVRLVSLKEANEQKYH